CHPERSAARNSIQRCENNDPRAVERTPRSRANWTSASSIRGRGIGREAAEKDLKRGQSLLSPPQSPQEPPVSLRQLRPHQQIRPVPPGLLQSPLPPPLQ